MNLECVREAHFHYGAQVGFIDSHLNLLAHETHFSGSMIAFLIRLHMFKLSKAAVGICLTDP